MKQFIGLIILSACSAVCARTIALWPLNARNGAFDGHCLINSTFNMGSVDNSYALTEGMDWALPPNPDSDFHVEEKFNVGAITCTNTVVHGFLYNDSVGLYLGRDRNFTIEGWLRINELPPRSGWGMVCGAFATDINSQNRWTLTFRRRPEERYACTWIMWANNGVDTVLKEYESEEASEAIVGKWMHVAFVHTAMQQVDAKYYDTWTLYIDGVQVGDTLTWQATPTNYTTGTFDLGARRTSANNLLATFDYWRISDEALSPDQFLNAGGGTGIKMGNDTVAYWPLEVTRNGGVDGRDAVGESPLTSGCGFHKMSSFKQCRSRALEDCAFPDNPPNPTVDLIVGNAGSLEGAASCANLQIDGAMLNLSQDFTVEGWFAPRTSGRETKGVAEQSVCYLFGTRPDTAKGWNLEYRAYGDSDVSFVIYCIDQSGRALVNNAKVSGSFDMANWYDAWRHVALTYDADGGDNGFGRWTLFIDGVETGHYDNQQAVQPLTDSRPFIFGGRGTVDNRSFQGKMDCLRICTAVLTPRQFMNAIDGTAATNVYGLWPLNVENGVKLDLRDYSGNKRHFADFHTHVDYQQVTAVPGEAPVITNPDPTPGFRGDRTKVNGSTGFWKLAGGNQHRSCLVTGSTVVKEAIKGRQNFTLECYYKRDGATQNQECLFVVCTDEGARVRLFRKNDGIYVWENLSSDGNLADTKIDGTADTDLVAGRWYHIAFVHSMETVGDVEKTVWRVYVDGVLKGTASQKAKSAVDVNFNMFAIGGRWFSDRNSVNGNLSSVRVSRVALDPSDFLCAAPKLPAEPVLASYWPLDPSGIGLGNPLMPNSAFVAEGTAAPRTERARLTIPNHTALLDAVIGNARVDCGSYALGTAGVLKADYAGGLLCKLNKPFTIAGWLKWTPGTGTADEDVVVAGNTNGHGVRIFIDKSGTTPRLKVKAWGEWPCTPWINTAFDANLSAIVNSWVHLAVVYDPNDYTGSWSMFVEGRQLGGKIYNSYYPSSIDGFRTFDFRLSSPNAPLSGSVDMWRITTAALSVEDLLYAKPEGFLFFIR